ncbi:Protochlorophyllide reductase iron-sulfur ATP-binding protein [ANME-1 cluster archaeon GoMg1]|nr:Protochlorophyllide reductase iron-sulfur ATP-binding protein [ANME-1 cluster archaeon GoMg1]
MKKIIVTGKGGVGKTTIIATLSRLLAREGQRVLVIDCDPSMNLAMSLGISLSDVLPLAENKANIHERLGMDMDDEQEPAHDKIEIDEVLEDYIIETIDGVKLIVMGTIPFGGSGCLCSSIALVKLLIGYITSGSEDNDFVMVDSQAGVEIFGRGLASEFDFTLVITEPMPKAVEVTRHVMKLSRDLGIKKQIVIVNKVEDGTEYEKISRELEFNPDQMYSVRYDKKVIEADKKGLLILDYAPHASVVEDIQSIKKEILEV